MRFALLVFCFFLVACQPAKEAQETVKDGATTAVKQVDRTRALQDLTSISGALEAYYVQNEKYPDSISELNLSLNHPEDIQYDAKTGKVRSKSFPNL